MGGRGSHFRTKLKERLRPSVWHGFGFITPVLSKKDKKHNKKLAKQLKPDTFHCRVSALLANKLYLTVARQDLKLDTDQYKHPVFLLCIAEGFFWDSEVIGVAFLEKFNPIKLPAAALILTMVCS